MKSSPQVVADQGGERVGGGELHALGDRGGVDVDRAAEDAGEREHVVDLVGEVGAAGRDHARVAVGDLGVDLGVRVGQAEDDRVGGHARRRSPRARCRR